MPPPTDDQIAGLSLKHMRRRARMPQHKVARALRWSQSRISKIERGERRMSAIELIRLARVLSINSAELVESIELKLDRTYKKE